VSSGLMVLPAIFICAFIDLVWLAGIFIKIRRRQGAHSIAIWLLVLLTWFAAYRFELFMMYYGSVESPDCAGTRAGHG
jgi:hypothetical protein